MTSGCKVRVAAHGSLQRRGRMRFLWLGYGRLLGAQLAVGRSGRFAATATHRWSKGDEWQHSSEVRLGVRWCCDVPSSYVAMAIWVPAWRSSSAVAGPSPRRSPSWCGAPPSDSFSSQSCFSGSGSRQRGKHRKGARVAAIAGWSFIDEARGLGWHGAEDSMVGLGACAGLHS